MKHITAFLLSTVMLLLLLPVPAQASGWIDDDIEGYYDGYLNPGRSYYFPLREDDGDQVEKGEDTGYRYKVEVEPRNKGVTASIVTDNDYQYVKVSVSSTAGRGESYYDIILTSTSRSDRDETYEDVLSVEIGYGDTYFTSESELDIYEDQTVIEFSDSVTTCYIYLPDGSEFAATLQPNTSKNKTDGINRVIDFYASSGAITAVESRYGTTSWLEYLRFYTDYTFGTSLFKIYAPDHDYIYSVDSNNNLARLRATRNEEFMVITTTRLGSYVLSSRDLGIGYESTNGTDTSSSGVVLPDSEPQAPSPMPSSGHSYPAATGGFNGQKVNPGTGVRP